MVDILHKVGIKSPNPNATYKALTAPADLAAWWTSNTKGDGQVGGVLKFRFGDLGFFDMKVTPGQGAAAVEADTLSYNANTGVISASGAVLLSYQGFSIRADKPA
mgnify:CR=1 FL=1